MFNAIKANKMSSWKEKRAYKVTILVQRTSVPGWAFHLRDSLQNKIPASKECLYFQ